MAAPEIIHQLVDRFTLHREAYRSGKYNETQLRREFLDPFLEALGWDVTNAQGYAEAYKDVIHEDTLEVEGSSKAPDYSFRIGGTRKFFVEAKKPSVNIEMNPEPAFQLRRYVWSAKLPLGILTDFDEFAIYECHSRPDQTDRVSNGRILFLHYTDYIEKWDQIAAIFSRDAILRGSFDKYAESIKGKKGTAEVDDVFLQEIERWRDLLARNIALRNPAAVIRNERDLNYAVQMTIDRIIFLRICEDRGIENEDQLREAAAGAQVYENLCALFKKADARYNSGLFHFANEKGQSGTPDTITLGLTIDDKVLKDIIRNLYYPDSPYVFSQIPTVILGQVYEQFLGKVIRLTAGHQAKVEEKPEVRKAGGVYYTPTYIVNYIVRNTVGKLLEGKTPREAASLKIVDPACGSGSFLLGAYEFLLDWHARWYAENDPHKWAAAKQPAIFQTAGGGWNLTTAERKRILLNNLHGVDIDAQAVEVTKLSLLLKVLEGENRETIGQQMGLFSERVLPDLSANIKCGNSLIGPDYYNERQMPLMPDEEFYRVNAFDWQREFAGIFAAGGFDAVIGNPPYVRQEELGDSKTYFKDHYKTFVPTADLYVSFIEKEMSLLKGNGLFGMIVSNKWLRAAYGEPLRRFLANEITISQVIDLAGLPVFEGATVRTIILICSPKPFSQKTFKYLAPLDLDTFRTIQNGETLKNIFEQNAVELNISDLKPEGWAFSNIKSADLLSGLLSKGIPITQYTKGKLLRGVITGFNQAFVIDRETRDKLIAINPVNEEIIKPLLVGRNVKRYSNDFAENYLIWTYIGVPIEKYPAILAHLKQYQAELVKRWDQGNYWWELRACDYYDKFTSAKIIYPDIATSCRFYLDEDGYFGTNTTYFIPSNDRYLLGILNSKVAQFFFTQVCAGLEGGSTIYLRFFGQYIQNFPVHPIDFTNPSDKAAHDRMVALVEAMLELHKRLPSAHTPQEQEMISRQIETTDRQIDRLVYQLYGLTEEEIKIVEGQ